MCVFACEIVTIHLQKRIVAKSLAVQQCRDTLIMLHTLMWGQVSKVQEISINFTVYYKLNEL